MSPVALRVEFNIRDRVAIGMIRLLAAAAEESPGHVRAAAKKLGRHVAIFADLGGRDSAAAEPNEPEYTPGKPVTRMLAVSFFVPLVSVTEGQPGCEMV